MDVSSAALAAWVRVPRPLAQPRVRLICLSHAGGGASAYYPWIKRLAAARIELRAVQYPGREDRIMETPIASCATMANALADVWPCAADGIPHAIYGHSMGAIIGFELIRELIDRGAPNLPCRFFASGRNPPHRPSKFSPIHGLPDAEFIEKLVTERGGNLPAAVISDREMLDLITPILRVDFTLSETHVLRPKPPIGMPISVFGGVDDPTTSATALAEWKRYSKQSCRMRMIAGRPFFSSERSRRGAGRSDRRFGIFVVQTMSTTTGGKSCLGTFRRAAGG